MKSFKWVNRFPFEKWEAQEARHYREKRQHRQHLISQFQITFRLWIKELAEGRCIMTEDIQEMFGFKKDPDLEIYFNDQKRASNLTFRFFASFYRPFRGQTYIRDSAALIQLLPQSSFLHHLLPYYYVMANLNGEF